MIIAFSFILCPKVMRNCAFCPQIIYSHCYRRFGVEVEDDGRRLPWVVWQCQDCTLRQCEEGVYGFLGPRVRRLFVVAREKEEKASESYDYAIIEAAKREAGQWYRARKEEMNAAGLDITSYTYDEGADQADRIAASMGYKTVGWDSERNRRRRHLRSERNRRQAAHHARAEQMIASQKAERLKEEKGLR